jgi:hypothetical protein
MPGQLPTGDLLDRFGAFIVDHNDVLSPGHVGENQRERTGQFRGFHDDPIGVFYRSRHGANQANDESHPVKQLESPSQRWVTCIPRIRRQQSGQASALVGRELLMSETALQIRSSKANGLAIVITD